jgi:DNA-binding NtrC family response regulator
MSVAIPEMEKRMPKVLIVDDERNVLKTLSLVLQRHDFTVMQAQNGADALKVLDKESCDFVLSDIRMSPMDGYTLASLIRQKHPDISIVFMSAFGFEDQAPAADPVAQLPKLTKPFPVSELIKVLEQEEDKRKIRAAAVPKTRVALLGQAKRNQEVLTHLQAMGFDAVLVQPGPDIRERILGLAADLYFVDEDMLTGEDWKVLNAIDQIQPRKPLVLLSDRAEARDPHVVVDLGMAVLNRKRCLEDKDWTLEFLKHRALQ